MNAVVKLLLDVVIVGPKVDCTMECPAGSGSELGMNRGRIEESLFVVNKFFKDVGDELVGYEKISGNDDGHDDVAGVKKKNERLACGDGWAAMLSAFLTS